MKYTIFFLMASLSIHQFAFAQDTLELKPSQSMSIAGKGPGQDGAINPYLGQDSYAIVENIGENVFSIRVQKDGNIIKTLPIKKGEMKKVTLLAGYELYFDTDTGGKAKAKVGFEKMDK
jgi:hypothetical protein